MQSWEECRKEVHRVSHSQKVGCTAWREGWAKLASICQQGAVAV